MKELTSKEEYGKSYQYYPVVSEREMGAKSLKSIVSRYFKNSYLGAVSTLVKNEDITADELRKLLDLVERSSKK